LEIDAVGLWQIVGIGESYFHLSGDELQNFVRRSLQTLLSKGARPVVFATDDIHTWERVDRYGSSDDQIIDAVIREWESLHRDPHAGGVWFATPEVYEATTG
jgi:hypothetical protein